MVQVVFSESAAGSLKMALSLDGCIGGATAVAFLGGEPSPAERLAAQRRAEEQERRARAATVPMVGSPADVLAFPLALSVGPLEEDAPGPRRLEALTTLCAHWPEGPRQAAGSLAGAQKNLAELLRRVRAGEPVRVWQGPEPDEVCGLFWLAWQLQNAGLADAAVERVTLPEYEVREDGTVVEYAGWGEVSPYDWSRMAARVRPVPGPVLRMWGHRWAALCRENAPLRAVVNGQLRSVPEDFYDFLLLREIARQPETFREAEVIGQVLGRYRPGIGDGWLAGRMENFIRRGLLEPITAPEPGRPAYARTLRKK